MKQSLKEVEELIAQKSQGARLDIGCGDARQDGWIGMDVRKMPNVDIVHDFRMFPWPIPDNSISVAMASHVLEHVDPHGADPRIAALARLLVSKGVCTEQDITENLGETEIFGTFMRFMDEVWRILEKDGQFMFVVPYAGSQGYWQDPTHVNPISEATIFYFDPEHLSRLWYIYKPKPWQIQVNTWQSNGNLEVVLKKREINESWYEQPAHLKS